ncbi:LamB/YcsF family protein [Pseudalkalibacillus hwajinpoensis]|uniref:5-oxoprolinase subunit A n=1 Tax=Guptibacillus hwajinpoensis TaxID=208199 RepID=A0A4U1MIF8_9BACL|nr:5-oxoprolinase subunit PxpA [Pseudalkalibacillus hwajinpoensis]TKD70521.1 LamB/YcsF family protein [Pseudalkalibacillus hwajinpoensis]
MTFHIDLNSDLGESFGTYVIGQDEHVLELVSSANVACGFHAGDPHIMNKTVKWAKEHHVGVGAHPGFPDLMGFGRRNLNVTPEDAYTLVLYQIGALHGFCSAHDVRLQHVKPHGALYNMASKDPELANAIAQAVKDFDPELILFGLANSELIRAAQDAALPYASEVFADRTYQPDGTLTPRVEKNAMIRDEQTAIDQVISMVKQGKVTAVDGSIIDIEADTVCVHGDEPSALAFIKALRKRFLEENILMERIGNL